MVSKQCKIELDLQPRNCWALDSLALVRVNATLQSLCTIDFEVQVNSMVLVWAEAAKVCSMFFMFLVLAEAGTGQPGAGSPLLVAGLAVSNYLILA